MSLLGQVSVGTKLPRFIDYWACLGDWEASSSIVAIARMSTATGLPPPFSSPCWVFLLRGKVGIDKNKPNC